MTTSYVKGQGQTLGFQLTTPCPLYILRTVMISKFIILGLYINQHQRVCHNVYTTSCVKGQGQTLVSVDKPMSHGKDRVPPKS